MFLVIFFYCSFVSQFWIILKIKLRNDDTLELFFAGGEVILFLDVIKLSDLKIITKLHTQVGLNYFGTCWFKNIFKHLMIVKLKYFK